MTGIKIRVPVDGVRTALIDFDDVTPEQLKLKLDELEVDGCGWHRWLVESLHKWQHDNRRWYVTPRNGE